MKYKMLVSDFDNTLLRTDMTIAPSTWAAIREFEQAGGKFTIATGRMLSTILKVAEHFKLHGELIAFQGGAVVDLDSGDLIYKSYLSNDDARELLEIIEKRGYYIHTYSDGRYYVNRYTPRTAFYEKANRLDAIVVEGGMWKYAEEHGQRLDKIIFGLLDGDGETDYAEISAVMDEFNERFKGRLIFNSSSTLLVEAVPVGNTKGEAVALVAARNGIKREEVICMGDASNDISMIQWAGLGVAVANATDDLKEAADLVTVSCDEDAVGTIIRQKCLGGQNG